MRAISGVIAPKARYSAWLSVDITFDAIPGYGSDLGNAIVRDIRKVYEEGDTVDRYFHSKPAYIVSILQSSAEDRTEGHREMTDLKVGGNCTEEKLTISWLARGAGTDKIVEIERIGFLVVGF